MLTPEEKMAVFESANYWRGDDTTWGDKDGL